MKSRPWVKLWDSWYTSRSHEALGGIALCLGPMLLSCANAEPSPGRLVLPNGKPITENIIIRRSRLPAGMVRCAIVELIDAGTLARDESGALWFPEFDRHQDSPEAARKRKSRDKSRINHGTPAGHVTDMSHECPRTSHDDVTVEAEGKRLEVRDKTSESESESETEQGPAAPSVPPQRRDEVLAVFAHYRSYHPRAAPKPTSKSKEWRLIVARLGEGSSVADLCRAIDGQHRSPWHLGQAEGSTTKYLSLSLAMRDASHVTSLGEIADNPPGTPINGKAQRNRQAAQEWLAKTEGRP